MTPSPAHPVEPEPEWNSDCWKGYDGCYCRRDGVHSSEPQVAQAVESGERWTELRQSRLVERLQLTAAKWQAVAPSVTELLTEAATALLDAEEALRLQREREQAVLDVVNLYGDSILHQALDDIGWFPRKGDGLRALSDSGPSKDAA